MSKGANENEEVFAIYVWNKSGEAEGVTWVCGILYDIGDGVLWVSVIEYDIAGDGVPELENS